MSQTLFSNLPHIPRKKIAKLVGKQWAGALTSEFNKPYMHEIMGFLKEERKNYTVCPPSDLVFNAYRLTPIQRVKIVIIGQDPYPWVGRQSRTMAAHGLAFSVPEEYGRRDGVPRSLQSIFKELEDDIGLKDVAPNPDLTRWAKQGVLLLNTHLTVRKNQSGSHSNIGWDRFTVQTLRVLYERVKPVVFVAWGSHAKGILSKVHRATTIPHHIIEAAHPVSRTRRGFFGTKPFSKINEFLEDSNRKPIDWYKDYGNLQKS